MLRASLIGITKTIPAQMQESTTVVPATMYPAYVKGADAQVSLDYSDITNKPTLNGVVLEGDLTLEDLGIVEVSTDDIDALFE